MKKDKDVMYRLKLVNSWIGNTTAAVSTSYIEKKPEDIVKELDHIVVVNTNRGITYGIMLDKSNSNGPRGLYLVPLDITGNYDATSKGAIFLRSKQSKDNVVRILDEIMYSKHYVYYYTLKPIEMF